MQAAPAQVKLVALIGFVCAVVATPSMTMWPFVVQLLVLAVVAGLARLNPGRLLRGLAIEVPFVAFAFAMPFLATGERITVAGLSVSVAGLWGAGTLLAKSTLGVLAALILAATTQRAEFVAGMQRLRLPSVLVEILSFMVRYLDVIAEQWHRMAIARASRGFRARNPTSWSALSGAVGTGFIRAFERGERVHLAMLARGYSGALPEAIGAARAGRPVEWGWAALLVATSLAVTSLSWGLA
ncbi:MAG: cobalt ECF transporter T component CbiQ [Actinobacteria bacterium]|nr:cobalt ECF transporter T component CbiQ [Propionicimonas sp.]MBU3975806.1 cobalt ECF transporter T component CbiQ [Actinomycetota bacterium]MBU3987356.1 cobalt ECF transporter T component CbiQ [Actinomycetota bacterium]MBU4006425.1 cobalt ECF transporter T component CbiQ [Actinomycetota bacterium]MBU4065304.1 cobalt ECF transporter T component CbiQ [Actinomycetota bacterium]